VMVGSRYSIPFHINADGSVFDMRKKFDLS